MTQRERELPFALEAYLRDRLTVRRAGERCWEDSMTAIATALADAERAGIAQVERVAEREPVGLADAAALLARQHAAVVRMVKRQPRYLVNRYAELESHVEGDLIDVRDLLAALATHRKGRTK